MSTFIRPTHCLQFKWRSFMPSAVQFTIGYSFVRRLIKSMSEILLKIIVIIGLHVPTKQVRDFSTLNISNISRLKAVVHQVRRRALI
jgi:hypothetical protein